MPVHLHHLLNHISEGERIIDTWGCVLKYIWKKKIASESYENKNLGAYKSAARRGKKEWCHFVDLRDLLFLFTIFRSGEGYGAWYNLLQSPVQTGIAI